jgi:hypothetical protein
MPEQLEKRLALLESEIELLKRKIALDPNDLLAKSDLMDSFEEYRSGQLVTQSIEELR